MDLDNQEDLDVGVRVAMSKLHLQTKMFVLDGATSWTLKVSHGACPGGNENLPLTLFRNFLIPIEGKVKEKSVFWGRCWHPLHLSPHTYSPYD